MQEVAKVWKWSRWWRVWIVNLKYNANQETLVEQKEGALVEEEREPKTPLQLAYEEGKDLKSTDK